MASRLISQTDWPVTVADAKLRLRIDSNTDDADIQMMIEAATQLASTYTRRSIATDTRRLTLDAFPLEIELPFPPIVSVESISYINTLGATVVLPSDQYVLDNVSEPGWILPADGVTWPDTKVAANVVEVNYTAGYGTSCPAALKQFILLTVGDMYRNRELTVDTGLAKSQYGERLLDIWVIPA